MSLSHAIARRFSLQQVLPLLFLAFALASAGSAQAQQVTVGSVYWSNEVDSNSDGYKENAQLNWDVDVALMGWMQVYEKIYYRPSSGGSWTLYQTTPSHIIFGNEEDNTYAIVSISARNTYDFRLDVYSGSSLVASVSNASNSALAQYKMGTGGGGGVNDRVTLWDAWWTNQVDADADGYKESARLNWDPDVATGSSSQSVFEKLYVRTTGTGAWLLFYTTPDHIINGSSSLDYQTFDLAPTVRNILDFKIEVYRTGQASPDFTLDPTNDSSLSAYKMGPLSSSSNSVTIQDAWWSSAVDSDSNGYMESVRLHWNPDVFAGSSTQNVFEKIYSRPSGTTAWTLLAARPTHSISGTSTADSGFLDIVAAFALGEYDFKIEVYRADQMIADYSRDPANDAELSHYKLEIGAASGNQVTISDAWWSDEVDINSNGYKSSARLHWNSDVFSGFESQSVYEKVYYKRFSGGTWTLLSTIADHYVTGEDPDDSSFLDVTGIGHDLWDWKIEIFRTGRFIPDYTRDPASDAEISQYPMEALYEDDPSLVVATPTFSPDPATVYTSPITVSLLCDTDEAEIRYTLSNDGSTPPDPTTTSNLFTGQPLPAGYGLTTFKARAWKAGLNPSPVALATFQVRLPARRTLPSGYTPGTALTVQLDVSPDAGVASWFLDETPPIGWTVSDINEGGSWNAVTQKINWGPFTSNATRTLTYQVTPPLIESGPRDFSGVATVDALPAPVSGDITLNPNPDHTAPQVLAIRCLDANPTSASVVRFAVDFSEPAVGVDTGDFTLTGGGTLAATQVTGLGGGPIVYTVSVNTGTGEGPLRLDLKAAGTAIMDLSGNTLEGGFSGQSYQIDRQAPDLIGLTAAPPLARLGLGVQLQFAASEALQSSPTLTVNGNPAMIMGYTGLNYTFLYSVRASDPDGAATVAIRAADRAGNVRSISTTSLLAIDKTPPAAPTSLALDAADDSGVSPTDGVTNHATGLTLRGVAETSSSVQLWEGMTLLANVASAAFAAAGQDLSLAEGLHHLSAVALDAAGNVSPAATLDVRVDLTAPATGTLSSPAHTNASPIRVTYSGTADSGAGLRRVELWVKQDAGAWQDTGQRAGAASGGFDFTPSGQAAYAFALVAEDLAGNRSAVPSGAGGAHAIYDTTIPQTLSIDRFDPAILTSATTVRYAVTFSEPVSGVDVGDFSPFTSGTLIGAAVSGISGGPAGYTVSVVAASGDGLLWLDLNGAGNGIKDLAGNALSGGFSDGQFYHVDRRAPGINGLAAIPAFARLGVAVNLGFSVSEALPSSPTLTVNGNPAAIVAHAGLGYTCQYTIGAADPEGPATVIVRAVDGTGNTGTVNSATVLRVDKTAPPAPMYLALDAADDTGDSNFDGITNLASGLSISGAAEAEAIVEFREGAVLLTTGTAAALTSPGVDVSLAEGNHNLSVVAVDLAGNRSAAATLAIRVDRTAPTPGTLNVPASTTAGPIPVSYSGARDTGAGLLRVELWVRKNAGAWQNSGLSSVAAASAFDFAPTGEGLYGFALVAVDLAGNRSAAPSGAGVVTRFDATSPGFSGLSAAPSPARSGVSVALQFTASEALATSPTVTVNGRAAAVTGRAGLVYAAQYAVTAVDADGAATVAVRGTDLAGLQGATSSTALLRIDQHAPGSGVQSTSGITSPGILTLRWTASDPASNGYASGVKSVEIYWSKDGGVAQKLGSFAPGVTSAAFDMSAHDGYGRYGFYAVATDVAGNVEAAPALPDWSYRWSDSRNAAGPAWRRYE